jgi:putative NADPH-quinone reductase
MTKRILLIQGHPDNTKRRFGHVLEDAYAEGALALGHEVRRIAIADLDFPVLRSNAEWENGVVPPALLASQEALKWCEHVVLFYPLWLGDMPALLKAYLEQLARPDFAFGDEEKGLFADKILAGRSARAVVTMGMPALVYRWYFRAHSVRSLERNILGFLGFDPVDATLVGGVHNISEKDVEKWIEKMATLGGLAE